MVPGMQSETLFDGKDVVLRASTHTPSGPLIITFSGMILPTHKPIGFAEVPLNKSGINNLIFVANVSHWWQCDEMEHALAAAREFIRRTRPSHIAAYGSSMGAYGALLFSGELSCNQVLALGPQYSIDPRKVPFESRWQDIARTLNFTRDDMATALHSPAEKFILYDNHSEDRHQVALLHGNNVHALAIPFGSHTIGQYLVDTGQLKPVFNALISGTLGRDLPGIVKNARRARISSSFYMVSLLDKLEQAPHHHRTARKLTQVFVEQQPLNFKLHNKMAACLLQEGNLKEARVHARKASDLNQVNPSSLRLLRDVFQAMGDEDGVQRISRRIAAFSGALAGKPASA
jgi:hypothetical protein